MIISSQHYINPDIEAEKENELICSGVTEVEIPCKNVGNGFAIQIDGHHTLAAARELGLKVKFVIPGDIDGLETYRDFDEALEANWNDGDWYNVETSNPFYEEYDFAF